MRLTGEPAQASDPAAIGNHRVDDRRGGEGLQFESFVTQYSAELRHATIVSAEPPSGSRTKTPGYSVDFGFVGEDGDTIYISSADFGNALWLQDGQTEPSTVNDRPASPLTPCPPGLRPARR